MEGRRGIEFVGIVSHENSFKKIRLRKARYTKGVEEQCKDNENYSHYLKWRLYQK